MRPADSYAYLRCRTLACVALLFASGCEGLHEEPVPALDRAFEGGFRATGNAAESTLTATGLDARLARSGALTVYDETHSVPVLTLSLSEIGRGTAAWPVDAPTEVGVTCDHPPTCVGTAQLRRGPISEWWTAGPTGLQQGFTVSERPAGTVGPMLLEVEVGHGSLMEADRIIDRTGRPWTVGGLAAMDADARPLPIRAEARDGALALLIDDTGARYPVHIDPVYETVAWYIPTHDDHRFSEVLSVVGDVDADGHDDAVIAAPHAANEHGWAGLYLGQPAPDYLSERPDVELMPTSIPDGFGESVSGAGDVNGDGYADFVVGAPETDNGRGAAFVYYGMSTGVVRDAQQHLDGAAEGDAYGTVVAGAGDVDGDGFDDLVVAAPGSATDHVFLHLGGVSGVADSPSSVLTFPSAFYDIDASAAGDVDGDGYDDVIVGLTGTTGMAGAAYLYYGSATGLLASFPATLTEPTIWSYGYFADSVTGAGDLNGDGYDDVLVMAPTFSISQTEYAFVYYGDGSGISTSGRVALTTSAPGRDMGTVVAGLGDLNGDGYDDLAVGALRGAYSPTSTLPGAFIHYGSSTGVSSLADYTVPYTERGIGQSIAGGGDLDGDGAPDMLIGAPFNGQGSAYVYRGVTSGLSSRVASREAPLADVHNTFGFAAGDFNDDGYDDHILGDLHAYGGAGAVYVYNGGPHGPGGLVDAVLSPATAASECWMGAAGDFNGDGIDDLAVGCKWSSADPVAAYLYPGSGSGLASEAIDTYAPSAGPFGMGRSMIALGDNDGDGFDELVVTDASGVIEVVDGSSTGFDSASVQALAVAGGLSGALATGDFNGDGLDDLAFNTGSWDPGFAVHLGSTSGLQSSPGTLVGGTSTSEAHGFAACDLNGDGFDELLVADPFTPSASGAAAGEVRVHTGSSRGLSVTPAALDSPTPTVYRFGVSIACMGDVDGDGFEDIMVADSARFRLYVGSSAGVQTTPLLDFESAVPYSSFVGGADYDGDGASDLMAQGNYFAYGYRGFADMDGDGVNSSDDCDDTDASVYPGATEVCDGVDNNCDGTIDEGAPTWNADTDDDGYGDPAVAMPACEAPTGYVSDATDCDDTDASVWPGADEVVGDGIDQDCDGSELCFVDSDGDGVRSEDGATIASDDSDCDDDGEAAVTSPSGDCDDARADVYPGAVDSAGDGVDQDCDGSDGGDSGTGGSGTDGSGSGSDSDKGGCATVGATPPSSGLLALSALTLLGLARRRA